VFRQTRTTESESGFEVIGRKVELVVLAKDFHHAMTVNRQRLAYVSDLICKRDFQRVETVAGILNHLRFLDPERKKLRTQTRVEIAQQRRSVPVVCPDERKRWIVKIVNRRSFAQKLGIDRDAKVLAHAFAGVNFERRNHMPLDTAGQ